MDQKRPLKPPDGSCPNETNPDGSRRDSCPLQCKYNFFESGDLTIQTYELKCLDCGWRDTVARRNDESDEDSCEPSGDLDSTECPFCGECDLNVGINPCSTRPDHREKTDSDG